ncbi:cupin domain-containing protein [Verrucomicrobium spinosum]|uniref:cupin domain-containing protein n=2 Tax=Verrucomicrobium spinosum TaxID=2736 RepID=UPI000174641A|nr:cupin domain-containing protein [Verrucomicrobium spinosum]
MPLSRRQLMTLLTAASGVPAFAATASAATHQDAAQTGSKVTSLLTRALAGHPESDVNMVLVEYAGGASSPAHRHSGPVFVYVLEGAVEMQITDGPLTKLTKGETYYEPPGGVHLVSRNASTTEPAKLLAFVIGPKGEAPTGPVDKH